MRLALAAASFVALIAGAAPALAQQEPLPQPEVVPFQSPVLTINQQQLFEGSEFGKAALMRLEQATAALLTENRKIEAALEAEERDLTQQRATMPPADFRPLADAFDLKVEAIRSARDAKSRSLTRQREADQKRFFEYGVPVLAELMREMGAVALMDQSAIVLSLDRIDITQVAIERINNLEIPLPQDDDAIAPESTPIPDETPTPDTTSAPDAQPAPDAPTSQNAPITLP